MQISIRLRIDHSWVTLAVALMGLRYVLSYLDTVLSGWADKSISNACSFQEK